LGNPDLPVSSSRRSAKCSSWHHREGGFKAYQPNGYGLYQGADGSRYQDALRCDPRGRFSDLLGEGGFRYLMEQGVHYANARFVGA
jgi:hypothetical protein